MGIDLTKLSRSFISSYSQGPRINLSFRNSSAGSSTGSQSTSSAYLSQDEDVSLPMQETGRAYIYFYTLSENTW